MHELELLHPELDVSNEVEGVIWSLKRGGGDLEIEYVESEDVYFTVQEHVQVFFWKRDPVNRPTHIQLLRVRLRPDVELS